MSWTWHAALPSHQKAVYMPNYMCTRSTYNFSPSKKKFSPSEKSSNRKINGMRFLGKDGLTVYFSLNLRPTSLWWPVAGFPFIVSSRPGLKPHSLIPCLKDAE